MTMEPELLSRRPSRPAPPPPGVQQLQESVNGLASRLAVLEERIANLRRQGQLTEQMLIENERETRADLKASSTRLLELSRRVEDVLEKVQGMGSELSSVVKKRDFTVLQRYMDLWEPMQFVTREEAKRLIEEAKKR